jgi:hypothetical protein
VKRWLPLVTVLLLTGCLAVGPGIPYKNGQAVDLSITQFNPGDTVWLSECAPAQTPTAATGCGTTLHGQPSAHLDSRGTGSAHFTVSSTVAGIGCAGWCTIVATNGSKVQIVPVPFVSTGSVEIGVLDMSQPHDIYVDGRLFHRTNVPHDGFAILHAAPGTYRIDDYLTASLPGGKPDASTTVTVEPGKDYGVLVYPTSSTRFSVTTGAVPPPPASGRLRVRFDNASPVTVTPHLGNLMGQPIAPGQGTTMILTGPSNVANGDDTWGATYPTSPPSATTCGVTGVRGGLSRGAGYVVTIVAAPEVAAGACPALIDGGITQEYAP